VRQHRVGAAEDLAVKRGIALAGVVVVIGASLVVALRGDPLRGDVTTPATPASIAKGEYLARVGQCEGCHTARGGERYAGGRGIVTPFGTVYATNLTPDPDTGLGRWTRSDFRRALHEGRSKDGRALTPAFPYTNFTQITSDDAAALHDYFRSLPPVKRKNRPHALRFPYDRPWMIAAWRALNFTAGEFVHDPARSAAWNRGAYLVHGLGHCDACHAQRNAMGAVERGTSLGGGTMPGLGWYAPSLRDPREGGVAHWKADDVAALLATGVAPGASVAGPMAEVVRRGTQYYSADDLRAVVEYLQSVPQVRSATSPPSTIDAKGPVFLRGQKLYADHCADCHGKDGEGAGTAAPALAGNRAVTMASATNAIRAVLMGGFAPVTAGNPRPYGMPPFAQVLSDADAAALVTYTRNAWGNAAPEVSALAINRERGAAVEE
jgi:mono/diheme cytochrome c family protein